MSLYPLPADGNRAQWIVDNAGTNIYRLEMVRLEAWPFANGDPAAIHFGDVMILTMGGGDAVTEVDPADRALESGQAKVLAVEFEYAAGQTGYSLALSFEGECYLAMGE